MRKNKKALRGRLSLSSFDAFRYRNGMRSVIAIYFDVPPGSAAGIVERLCDGEYIVLSLDIGLSTESTMDFLVTLFAKYGFLLERWDE
jgi:hypothetical protein